MFLGEVAVSKQSLAKLIAQVDPTVHCDLCPAFHIGLSNGNLEVFLHTEEDRLEWYMSGNEVKRRLRRTINKLREDVRTRRQVEQFKIDIAQALIREVHTGCLFKGTKGVEDEGFDDNEEIQ